MTKGRLILIVLGLVALGSCLALTKPQSHAQEEAQRNPVLHYTSQLVFGTPEQNAAALRWLDQRGESDVTGALLTALRFSPLPDREIVKTLEKLTGATAGPSWFDWQLWIEANPLPQHESLIDFKRRIYTAIDPRFEIFIDPALTYDIRVEEITWGGVRLDGIPALDNPAQLRPEQATYIQDTDLVFGVNINGDARAYPLRILNWHEMFNDVIGGVPVSLAYCTLCGSGILFEGQAKGLDQLGVQGPFTFGSSGFLYRSNKLMYDRATYSLWNQFTGQPVSGKLQGSGIKLTIRPVVITSWKQWLAANPETTIIDIQTGFQRDYGSGVAYRDYFSSPALMFPAVGDRLGRLQKKDYVFGMRLPGGARAWPLALFKQRPVLNDAVGSQPVVVIGNADTTTARAYVRQPQETFARDDKGRLISGSNVWAMTKAALVSEAGERRERLPRHVAFWFAWAGYLGDQTSLSGG